MALPSATRNPTVAGVIKSARSMVQTSSSISAQGLGFSFIPPAYRQRPQLCMLSTVDSSRILYTCSALSSIFLTDCLSK